MASTRVRTVLVVLFCAVCCGSFAYGEVWGVKTQDIVGPPATLFHFAEDGSGLTGVGAVTLSGVEIDVDGLAMNAQGVLYGFAVTSSGASSQLLPIDTTTAVATAIGTPVDLDIRGAVFAADGRLLTLDAQNNELLEINPATGAAVGPGIGLTVAGVGQDVSTITDIAQGPDGAFTVSGIGTVLNELYSLDVATGQAVLVHTDTVVMLDGRLPALVGLAFSDAAPDPDVLFAFDFNNSEDILAYQTDAAYARTVLHANIFPAYNAGRGDLATTPVPEPASMLLIALAAPLVVRRKRR